MHVQLTDLELRTEVLTKQLRDGIDHLLRLSSALTLALARLLRVNELATRHHLEISGGGTVFDEPHGDLSTRPFLLKGRL
jgi:hypothetical protein